MQKPSGRIIVFGATGYTGSKVVTELVSLGIRPIIVGRNPNKLEEISKSHDGLETRAADVTDPSSLRNVVEKGDVLVSTVGPFVRYGQPAVDAALDAGAHYLDSTGEPAFIRKIYEQADAPAKKRGILMLTAFGNDYVPGHTAAAAALVAAGPTATRVDIGYFAAEGTSAGASEGTRASLVGAAFDPGLFWHGGQLVLGFGGTRLRSFAQGSKQLDAISVPGSEHIWLPKTYPQLTDVGVYLGWFGKRSRSVYRFSRIATPLLNVPGVAAALKSILPAPKSQGRGPSEAALSQSGSHVIALAHDHRGKLLARADLVGINGYTYTAKMLAWGAREVMLGETRVTGARGPIDAFGYPRMIVANKDCGLDLTVAAV